MQQSCEFFITPLSTVLTMIVQLELVLTRSKLLPLNQHTFTDVFFRLVSRYGLTLLSIRNIAYLGYQVLYTLVAANWYSSLASLERR